MDRHHEVHAVGEKKSKSGWKKPGKFAGCNEKRSAARAAAREEKRKLGIVVREPKPRSRAKVATSDKAVGDAIVTAITTTSDKGIGDARVTTSDKCVGESAWGDPFLVCGIFDLD